MTDYLTSTPIGVSVHMKSENPIFGADTTHILIDDLAGGPFLVLRQFEEGLKPGEIRLDLKELEAVLKVARKLIKAQK